MDPNVILQGCLRQVECTSLPRAREPREALIYYLRGPTPHRCCDHQPRRKAKDLTLIWRRSYRVQVISQGLRTTARPITRAVLPYEPIESKKMNKKV